jgi:hypothetical protein
MIMPKNYSYVIKVEKICPKRYLEILVAFIVLEFLLMIRPYFLVLAVLFITLSTLQIRNTFHYQMFLKIHEILPKVKRFTKSGHTVISCCQLVMATLEREPAFSVGHSKYFMLIQCVENIGEGLLHACISSYT